MARWLVPVAFVFAVACQDDRPAEWGYIHAAIIAPNCTTSSCHTKVNAQAGVQLQTVDAAYAILVGRACEDDAAVAGNYVVPGRPEESALMQRLRSPETSEQMPPDRPLPDPDIDLIEQWILEGALCN